MSDTNDPGDLGYDSPDDEQDPGGVPPLSHLPATPAPPFNQEDEDVSDVNVSGTLDTGPAKQPTAVGTKTSEFMLSSLVAIIVVVCATFLLYTDKIEADNWSQVISFGVGLPSAGYAVSRGLTKLGTGTQPPDG